jgi:hypothetical protein
MDSEKQAFVDRENWEFSRQWIEFRPKVHPGVPCRIVQVGDIGEYQPIIDGTPGPLAFESIPEAAEWAWHEIQESKEATFAGHPEATISQ